MSDYCQWVASSSSHVVLDGVPFKIVDSFRVAPVLASTEDRLCLRSQSSCLKDEYVFDKEKEYVHWYKSLLSFREAEEEKRKNQAAAAAAAAAAVAAAAATAASANAAAADTAVATRDGSTAVAAWSPGGLRAGAAAAAAAAAGDDADVDSRHDFRDSGHRRPMPAVVPPKPKHAALPPGLGHDLLQPKPAVPRKPLLSGAAAASTTAATLSSSASPAANANASLPQLDLALFEREEDVFDKMQMKTLNDLEELKSVLLPTHGTRPVAADGLSAGDAGRTGGTSPQGSTSGAVNAAVAATAVDRAGRRSNVEEDETRHLLNSASFGLTVSCSRSSGSGVYGADSRSTVNSSNTIWSEIAASAAASAAAAAGLDSSDAMTAVSPGTGLLAESHSSSVDSIASGRYAVGATSAAHATSASSASVSATVSAGEEQPAAAVRSRPVAQKKAPVVPPRRCNSTDDASVAPDVLASVALAAGQLRNAAAATEAMATASPAAAAADGTARHARPAPPPPPAKPTLPAGAHGVKPKPLQSRHSAAAGLPALSASKPFSYTAAADASPKPRLPSIAASQANALTVKNIVWPDLLSSPEPKAISTVTAATHSSAFASGLPAAAHFTLSHSVSNGETAGGGGGKRSPVSASVPIDASKHGTTGSTARNDVGDDGDLTSKLVAMGFPSRHVESALRHFGKDDKKAVEHLCILSDLVHKGHDWRIAQIAILTYPGQLGKVEEYLNAYQRLLEYGFEGEKIQQALATHDANAEKALDMLAGAASS